MVLFVASGVRNPTAAILALCWGALVVGGCVAAFSASDATDAPHIAARAVPATGSCPLVDEDLAWARGLMEVWTVATDEVVRTGSGALPWIVVFDTTCVWHLAPEEERLAEIVPDASPIPVELRFRGSTVRVWSHLHGGEVRLPSGAAIPAGPFAAASVYGGSAFFGLAMAAIWRTVVPDGGRIDSLERFFLGVAAHELVHTLQLPAVAARVQALGETSALPENLDDDVVERDFGGDSAYVALFTRELELFHEAAHHPDRERAVMLAKDALRLARERRAAFFTGDRAIYAPLEEIFLNMEGVAVWTHYRLHQLRPDLVEFEATGNASWSQDHGFALFLLIDELVPSWRNRVLGPELASPFDLLEEALGAGGLPD